MHILLTGTPGSGKTTLAHFAQSQGDNRFYDTDEISGLCEWRDFETGEVMGLVTEFLEDGTDDWYKKYGWFWREDFLRNFLAEHHDVILCGSAENVVELYELFDNVAILLKSEEELLSNLQSPDRKNPFGKTTVQRANFMNWQNHLQRGITEVDSLHIYGNDTEKSYNDIVNKYFS